MHQLSDGRVQAIQLTDTMIARLRPLPRGLRLDAEHARPTIAELTRSRGASPREALLAPVPRHVTPDAARNTLSQLRASWPNESRISANRIVFSRQLGTSAMRVVFDETIGAEVESELRDPMGWTSTMYSTYSYDGNGYRLSGRERIVSDGRATTRYVETFDVVAAKGGTPQ